MRGRTKSESIHGVMVIVDGNEHCNPRSNPGGR